MAKKTSSKAEWRRFKKFEQENEKLRKEVTKLRKYAKTNIIDVLEQKNQRAKDNKPAALPTCSRCGNQEISFITIERKDGNFEIKVCQSCQYRTEMKKKKTN